MSSVWTSVLPWVFWCLFSSIATTNPMKPKPINIHKERATKGEGSCVTISCSYQFQESMTLLWLKDPKWNATKHAFDGTVVYSNTKERPQDLEYSNRVKFFHEPINWATCSLKINDLKVNDSGNYTFRYIKGSDKYLSSAFTLTVMENPCKVHIKPPHLNRSLKEGDTVSLYCATSAKCESYPQWQSSVPSDFDVKMDGNVEEKYSELKLTLNWKDDGRTLICQPSDSTYVDCLDRSFTLKVEYAPKETKVSETSKDVKEGEQVKISCSSKAQPKPNFTWFKHQNSFSQTGENLSLYVKAPADGGRFYCQAKNEHGRDNSTNILINVIYAPKGVNISPAFKNLTEGEQLTLTCLVQDSNPAVERHSYKWYKDGQEINYQTDTLTVLGVKQTDQGDYQCKAKNSVGETKSVDITKVSVFHVPQNASIQGVSKIKLGFSLNLKCVVLANPLPNRYYWYFKPEREERFLMLSHKYEVYRIENVAVSNAGVYVCSAENVIGTGGNSSEVNVLVLYPPKKPNLTMKQVVKENEFYSITCSVESSPQAKLMLSRSSLTNPENGRIIKTVEINFLNFTSKALMEHAGVYNCSAKNSEGQNSANQYLEVLYAPKNVIASASPGNELKEGSELKLTCKADSVPQVTAYTWKKSSRAHSVTVGNGQTLTLTLVKSSDSDHYFCITSNEIGSAESPPIYIRVKYQPHITITHNMTSLGLLDEAVPVHLTCSVQCDPPATFFAWYRLEEKDTVLSNNQNYTVQPQNPGMYYCEASNEIGKSRSVPFEINHNQYIKLAIKIIISLLAILFLIGVLFLLLRIVLTKRCKGTNEGSRNNIRENLVMEGSSEIFGIRDNHSSTAVHSNPQANRNTAAGRPNYDIQTTYDVLKLPPTKLKHRHTEEDLTTVNYAMLQFMNNNPNKSVPSHESGEPDYAQVSKQKHIAKEQQGGHEDYENVSGGCTKKQPFPNINWDSDTSESEDEVNYTKVSFTATSHHNPQKDKHFSDEEDKTEYSEVKI
ncbi:B-cell receptor CD22 isoform X2 [Tachysurus fulvidraco]|uniref:B-cell receptor CD22 isoform X2 n=1 Tax=Tachysurus fulvidraco TaxID=1234273 RepID=UPI001FED8F14|nr:B-cell receptor CD22 isoform X2 [Tachysurus fulvidraco]